MEISPQGVHIDVERKLKKKKILLLHKQFHLDSNEEQVQELNLPQVHKQKMATVTPSLWKTTTWQGHNEVESPPRSQEKTL